MLGLIITSLVLLILIIILGYSIIPRVMSENRWFFVMPPAMSMVSITKDKSPVKVIINCNDQEIIKRLKEAFGLTGVSVKEKKNKKGDIKEYQYFKDGKFFRFMERGALCWVGLPWIYKVHEWYEKPSDEDDPVTSPEWYLTLKERTLDYAFTQKDNEQAVTTRDPIETDGHLVLQCVTYNPLKTIFGVEHWTEALKAKIFAKWRLVVAKHPYFSSKIDIQKLLDPEKTKDAEGVFESMADPDLLINVRKDLQKELGLLTVDEKSISLDKLPPEGAPAYEIYKNWGLMFTIEVKDVNISNVEIKKVIEDLLQARIDAIKKLQVDFAESQGKKMKIMKEAEALEDLAKRLGKSKGGRIVLQGKAMQEALSSVDSFIGGTGGIEQIIAMLQGYKNYSKKSDGGDTQ